MYCKNCGNQRLDETTAGCSNCGTAFGIAQSQPQTQTQPQKRQIQTVINKTDLDNAPIFNLLGWFVCITTIVLSFGILNTFFIGVFFNTIDIGWGVIERLPSLFSLIYGGFNLATLYFLIMITLMPLLLTALKKADNIAVKKFALITVFISVATMIIIAITSGLVFVFSDVLPFRY